MSLIHTEVRLVRADKDAVWKTVSKLDQDFIDNIERIEVKGSGKNARRIIDFGKNQREEKVKELKDNETLVFEVTDGKAEGQLALELEDHDLGTMIIHRAQLKGVGMFGKGRYKKELKARLDGIRDAVEGTGGSD